MLAFEARFTPDEAAAGLSHVSDDIGSFHGGHLADDLYARWMQLGAFQPVDRMHSDHGDRLPWNYTGAAAAGAASSLRLRESLVPYTYTLARQANTTGVPIVRPLYLDYPSDSAAYTNPGEYLYGDNVLVAPITTPNDSNGNGSVSVWFPPGTWTDYFTGHTYTGPSTATVTDPLSQMPVFLKAGGILPTRTDYVDNQQQSPLTKLTVNVPAGADGSYNLYQDAGEGTGYRSGQSTTAPLSWNDTSRTLTIGAQTGSYSGAPTSRAYTLRLSNSDAPTAVSVDGVQIPETGWAWNANRRIVTVTTAALPLSSSHTITLSGSATANPTSGEVIGVGGLCLDVQGGQSADGTAVQVYGCNHTASQQVTHQSDGTRAAVGQVPDRQQRRHRQPLAGQHCHLRRPGLPDLDPPRRRRPGQHRLRPVPGRTRRQHHARRRPTADLRLRQQRRAAVAVATRADQRSRRAVRRRIQRRPRLDQRGPVVRLQQQ